MHPPSKRLLEAPAATITEAYDWRSLEGRARLVRDAFAVLHAPQMDAAYPYVDEVYEDAIIWCLGDDTYRQPYTIDDNADVTFGTVEEVVRDITYRTITEAAADGTAPAGLRPLDIAADATLLEAVDNDGGWVWRVTMVQPGVSKNNRRYRPEILREAVALYEGARAYDGHRLDQAVRNSSAIGGTNPLIGWHDNVAATPLGALESDFHISRSAANIREAFISAWQGKRPDLIGFSHDVAADTSAVLADGRRIEDVTRILAVNSVDVVATPSAGGKVERLVASIQDPGKEQTMTPEEFRRLLQAGSLTATQITEAITDPGLAAVYVAHTATPAQPTPTAPTTITEAAPLVVGSLQHAAMVREAIAAAPATLPEPARDAIRAALATVTDEASMVRTVTETASIWAAAAAALPTALPGQGSIRVSDTQAADLQKGLDGFFLGETVDGVRPFRSIKEAYVAFTGAQPYAFDGADFNRRVLAESVGCIFEAGGRLTESLSSGTWNEALADSVTRALIAEYSLEELSTWRQIVSATPPITDFRSQKRDRIGGYDVLPIVGEQGVYQPLISPTDEEASYAISKKGGTEDYTLEMIANDDVGALRRIPRALGRAAALTLYRAIWNDTIVANAVIYDAVALFAAGHNNTTAVALAEAGVTSLRTKMVKQTQLGESSGFIGLRPRFLAVPTDLYVPAFKLANSAVAVVGSAESATTPNAHRGLTVIEVPTFTDADDWYLIADPKTVPTIEVGFYQGREEPELLVQDQPAVGSVFTADKVTWKIRHIWGLTVLDYRGFQRGTV